MYGQFQPPIASAAKWIFFGFFVVVLMALFLGANIKDATWLNSDIAAAEAQRIQIEAAHQQATYELQEQLAQAQTVAEIQAIQREQKMLDALFEHDIQALAQDLAHREIAFKTWMTVVAFVGGAISIAIIIGTILWVGSKALANVRAIPPYEKPTQTFIPTIEKTIHPLPQREPYEPLEWPERLFEKRLIERQQELAVQQTEIDVLVARMNAISNPARISKEEYDKMPLAGD